MVLLVMVIGDVITTVLGARLPVEAELSLSFSAAKPVEAGIHPLHLLLYYGVVEHANGSGIVSLDSRGRLWPYHSNQGLTKRDHLLCCDEEFTKSSLGCRIHNELGDSRNGEAGTVEAWEGVVIGEKYVGARLTDSFGFVVESSIIVGGKT